MLSPQKTNATTFSSYVVVMAGQQHKTTPTTTFNSYVVVMAGQQHKTTPTEAPPPQQQQHTAQCNMKGRLRTADGNKNILEDFVLHIMPGPCPQQDEGESPRGKGASPRGQEMPQCLPAVANGLTTTIRGKREHSSWPDSFLGSLFHGIVALSAESTTVVSGMNVG